MTDRDRELQHARRNLLQKAMTQREDGDAGRRQQDASLDHHGLAGQQNQGIEDNEDRQQGWSQNADDIGRQYDQSGFAQGGQDRPQQQGWSDETRGDRRQFQSEYDEQIEDDGSMIREQKLQQGWQDPEDPSQIADEGLIDEDEEDAQGGRI